MLEEKDGYRLIDLGIDRNLMVYDVDAPSGVCTKLLIYHIKRNAPLITNIIMSPEVFWDFVPIHWTDLNNITCFGIKLSYDSRLDEKGVWTQYFLNRGSCMALTDSWLLLAYRELLPNEYIWQLKQEDVILGSC